MTVPTNNEEREALIEVFRKTRCIATPRLERGYCCPVPEEAERMTDAVLAALAARRPPMSGDNAELLESLKVAMLGTVDGDFIDPNSEIPAGEMLRLAAEWLTTCTTALSASQPREVEAAPSDTDREAWDKVFPKADGDVLGIRNLPTPWEAFVAGRTSHPVQVEVTDDMVKRGQEAWTLSMSRAYGYRRAMRAALVAALGGGDHAE